MFTINELCKKSAFYRHTIKFCDCWFTVLQGPTCLAEHTLEFPCFSAVLEATHNARLRPLEGRYASSKSPSRVWHWDVAGRNKSNCLPDDWLWFALRQILKCFFFTKTKKKQCVNGQTCLLQLLLFVVVSSLLLLFCSACVKSPSWQELSIWDAMEEDGNVDAVGRHRLTIFSTTSIIRDTKTTPNPLFGFYAKTVWHRRKLLLDPKDGNPHVFLFLFVPSPMSLPPKLEQFAVFFSWKSCNCLCHLP